MHTLLPYDDFRISAMALSDTLLAKQIKDCVTILNTLHEVGKPTTDPRNPTVKAWKGYELQLCEFGLDCCDEWKRRHGENEERNNDRAALEQHLDWAATGNMEKPPWVGDENVHLDYRGLLVYLEPEKYSTLFNVKPCEPNNFRYPVK